MKNIVRNNNKAVLLLDSGCSVNISNDKNLLTNIRQIDPIIVEVANGECIEAYESGDLTLGPYTHPSTDIELTIELQNVIYSNQFSANLISVAKLTQSERCPNII